MNENLIRNFRLYWDNLDETAVNYEQTGPSELVVTLDDGSSYLYEDSEGSIRRLPKDKYNMTENEYKREFGFRLRKLMFSRGFTQTSLADATGLNQAQISSYANGKNSPSYYNAAKIAKALECSLDDLTYL